MSSRPRCLLAAALLAALSPLPAVAQDAPSRVVVGMTLEPPHLDPTAGAAAAIDEVTYANIFEGLTRIDETGTVQPALAESWDVSDDGLVYTFHLHDGVTFHDGTAFDADDVVFSLDRARAEDSVNAQKGYFEPIAEVTALSPTEVEVRLSGPDGLFLFHLGQGDAAMVAPESAETNGTNPIGTGPFRFVDRVEGDRVMLERYPDYWGGADAVALDEAEFRFMSDPSAQIAAMLAGDIDAFPNIGAPESLPIFEDSDRLSVVVGTTEGETIMAMNNRRPPFDDVRVRRAVAHAIDRQELIDGAMFGYGTPIGSHFAPHNPAYVDLTGESAYDPELARSLLAEAGYPDGFEVSLALPPPSYARRGGEVIQAQLARVGITVNLVTMEWGQWLEQVFRGYDYDMSIVSHTEPMDIAIYARGPDDYYFGYDSAAFNAIIAELNATVDPDARNALLGDAQRQLAEDRPVAFLFQLPKLGVFANGLTGFWANSPIQANDLTGVAWE
ncbi:MAG: ABC transporter substrate-binding protein [Rhodospirillaceae bacterium]|nr:ABC transporter substrate-binding protein [Rhodospirillaceae bacterium]